MTRYLPSVVTSDAPIGQIVVLVKPMVICIFAEVSCMFHKESTYAISGICGSCINSLHEQFWAQVNAERLYTKL